MQKQTKEVILANIRGAIVNARKLKGWISTYSEQTQRELTVQNFLTIYPQVTLEDIYKIGWNKLNGRENVLALMFDRAISSRFITCRSRSYLKFLLKLFREGFRWDETDEIENQMVLMVHYDFWQRPGLSDGFSTLNESLIALAVEPQLVATCVDVLELLLDRLDISEMPMDLEFPNALQLHGRYSRDQILAAFGENHFEKNRAVGKVSYS